jgi:hypothetical protein
MTGFDPTTYDDHTLITAIKNLRHPRSEYLGSWGKQRLTLLEREANVRKLQLPKHNTQSHDPM